MDKRSLLFLACVSASLFGLQAFFGFWNSKPASNNKPTVVATAPKPYVVQARAPQSVATGDEAFYVLETKYQQLVFSTRGGSLAEINLPLQSKADPESLVKEINVDRRILAESPQNARFPLRPYTTADGQFHETGQLGGYYPLLRRPLVKADGTLSTSVAPEFYALAVTDGQGLENQTFRMTSMSANSIQFEGSSGGRRVVKTYTIPAERNGPYCLTLETQVDGDPSGLWLSSGIPEVELVSGSYTPQLKIQVPGKTGPEVDEVDLPKSGVVQNSLLHPNWISNCNGFLGLLLDPLNVDANGYQLRKVEGTELPTRLSLIDAAYQLYKPASYPGYATLLPLSAQTTTFRIFAGPYDEALFKRLDELYEDPLNNYNPEYRLAISIQGWFSFISQPFAKFLFFLMQLFYAVTRSWAMAIILLTIALRAMMYPLNNWSIRSTLKMQEIAPRVKAVQERNKKDPKKGQAEVMSLYREAGVNPFSGCLPMLLQMPFLIGMFYMLKSSFPLRGAPFIPGWINDLAAPDVVFSWGPPFWLVGNELHLLPILMGVVMWLQAKMSQKKVSDASQLTDQERQQKAMGTMMALLFMVMFYNFPSGLNIYFMLSTLLGIAQQKWMMKRLKEKA